MSNRIKGKKTREFNQLVYDWHRASFQTEVSDLIQLITEGRLRHHASGPADYYTESVT